MVDNSVTDRLGDKEQKLWDAYQERTLEGESLDETFESLADELGWSRDEVEEVFDSASASVAEWVYEVIESGS